jgi:tRNA (uracil-5-)-methyltransferase
VDFIGRARKQKFVVERDFVVERLMVHQEEYVYKQVENSFTQPNGKVAEKMLEWAVECSKECDGDLLELYCGNGNFSLALAQNFRKVLDTELAKPSVEAAQWNIEANNAENVKIARLSAEEFTQAMRGEREFSRLSQQGIELGEYDFKTVFVDSPRSGMDEESVAMSVEQRSRV